MSYVATCMRDSETVYAMGDLMIDEILSHRDAADIGRIIAAAHAGNGDFERAIQQVTGKDARAVFQHVLATHWKPAPESTARLP